MSSYIVNIPKTTTETTKTVTKTTSKEEPVRVVQEAPICYDYKEDVEDIDKHWSEDPLQSFPQRRHVETGSTSHEEYEWKKKYPVLLGEGVTIEPQKRFKHHQTDPVEGRLANQLE